MDGAFYLVLCGGNSGVEWLLVGGSCAYICGEV